MQTEVTELQRQIKQLSADNDRLRKAAITAYEFVCNLSWETEGLEIMSVLSDAIGPDYFLLNPGR